MTENSWNSFICAYIHYYSYAEKISNIDNAYGGYGPA